MGYKITTLVENCVYGRKLQAEHGLSLYIETSGHRLLFDTGASDLFIRNARLLHIDLQKVDYLILSHGHSDHTGGLRYFLELNTQATVVCKREIFSPKFIGDTSFGFDSIILPKRGVIIYLSGNALCQLQVADMFSSA